MKLTVTTIGPDHANMLLHRLEDVATDPRTQYSIDRETVRAAIAHGDWQAVRQVLDYHRGWIVDECAAID